jgi:hypothetical protein
MVNCNFYIKEMAILQLYFPKNKKGNQISYGLPFYFKGISNV